MVSAELGENVDKRILLLGILLLVFAAGCGNNNNEENGEIETFTIAQDGSFTQEECSARGLTDKVMMLESKYCGHCKKTLPLFLSACEERDVVGTVLDIAETDQRAQMESHKIDISYTPTFIFGCKYYIGGRDKQGYLELLDEFLSD